MTNGEALQKTFPNSELETLSTKIVFTLEPRTLGQQVFVFDKDWWVAEYKEPTTKHDLAVDYISREDALMCLTGEFEDRQYEPSELVSIFSNRIKHLSSVTPQPRKGHWITHHPLDHFQNDTYMCSECGKIFYDKRDECPICGAKMDKENMDDK